MLDTFQKLLDRLGRIKLESVGTFDVSQITGLARELPLLAGVMLLVAGTVATLVGGRRLVFRFLLAPLAALAGYALAPPFAATVHLSPPTAAYAAAAILGLAALLWPPLVVFLAFGALGGNAGAELRGDKDRWVGIVPGFLVGGLLGVLFSRAIAVIGSAVLGATMLVLGLLNLISFTRLSGLAFGYPVVAVGLAGCIAVFGIAFQYKFSPAEDAESRAKRKAKKLEQRQLEADAKARDKRFKEYGRKADRAANRERH